MSIPGAILISKILLPETKKVSEDNVVMERDSKNALDAIENKTGSIKVFVKATRKNVDIEVSDSGKGIDINRRKDVFRPGYSTKKRGWGLGLSLVKRIIEEYHKGKIKVLSSSKEGTIMQISLKSDKK
jgi:signal transduction histidine kinase